MVERITLAVDHLTLEHTPSQWERLQHGIQGSSSFVIKPDQQGVSHRRFGCFSCEQCKASTPLLCTTQERGEYVLDQFQKKEANPALDKQREVKRRLRMWLGEYQFESYYSQVNSSVLDSISEKPDKSLTVADLRKFLLQKGSDLGTTPRGKPALKLKLTKDNMEEVWRKHRPKN